MHQLKATIEQLNGDLAQVKADNFGNEKVLIT